MTRGQQANTDLSVQETRRDRVVEEVSSGVSVTMPWESNSWWKNIVITGRETTPTSYLMSERQTARRDSKLFTGTEMGTALSFHALI